MVNALELQLLDEISENELISSVLEGDKIKSNSSCSHTRGCKM